jgi:hypothetical protein
MALFITDALANLALTICPLSKPDNFPIFQFFHTDCQSTNLLMHWC